MTDFAVFRTYEPHELKNGRYPVAWDTLDIDALRRAGQLQAGPARWGIKDLVRHEAGHRCVRCGHPYVVGKSAIWEDELHAATSDTMTDRLEGMDVETLDATVPNVKGKLWSPCDQHCTHGGPFRVRSDVGGRGGWTSYSENAVDAGERVRAGFETQAAWRILTVHHLNERKFDCRWHNLVSLCQRCHLVIQRKVEMNQVFPFEHSDWFKPYAAAFYAYSYLGQELTRAETMERLDELLELERVA